MAEANGRDEDRGTGVGRGGQNMSWAVERMLDSSPRQRAVVSGRSCMFSKDCSAAVGGEGQTQEEI